MKKVFWAVGFLGLLACLYVLQGSADTRTGTFDVWAFIPSVVSIQTSGMDFGQLSPTNEVMSEGWILVSAQQGLNYSIALDIGYGAQMIGQETRVMTSPENPEPQEGEGIQYELYQDPGMTVVWGDEGYGDTYPIGSALGPFVGTGDWDQYQIFGKAYPYSIQGEGEYQDIITITVWY